MDLQEVGWGRALIWQRQVVGTCECGNEPSGSTKYSEFLDQLRTGQLLKKDAAVWSKQLSKAYEL